MMEDERVPNFAYDSGPSGSSAGMNEGPVGAGGMPGAGGTSEEYESIRGGRDEADDEVGLSGNEVGLGVGGVGNLSGSTDSMLEPGGDTPA